MLKFISTIVALLLSIAVYAQKQNVYFLKNNGNYVNTRDSADYIRIVREPDSASVLYNVLEYYKEGQKKLVGQSATIDPLKFEGTCISFYKNGHKESIKTYDRGFVVDKEYDYYPNGKPSVVKQFSTYDDARKYSDLTYNCLLVENYDSLGTVQVSNGNGYYKSEGYFPSYDSPFTYIEEQGLVKNGKMEGEWRGSVQNPKISYIEYYKNGVLINGTATDSLGTNTLYTKLRDKFPEFKGGIELFYGYLGRNIRYPADAREHNTQGRVVIQFVVEKDGIISMARIIQSVSPSVDAEAFRVIINSPRWDPALRFGQPVKCLYSVPIAFTLAN